MAGIRTIAGFEYFLRSLPFQDIQHLAQEAPLVYLAATAYGGFALIVQASGVNVLELPGLTEEALREQVVGPKNDPALRRLPGGLPALAGKPARRDRVPRLVRRAGGHARLARPGRDDAAGGAAGSARRAPRFARAPDSGRLAGAASVACWQDNC